VGFGNERGQAEVDDAMRVLIADGEIFEPRVGRFKRLRYENGTK
jgi:hypothetical protein